MTPTPFADALRSAIQASGLTVYAVAKRAGISQQVLSRWLSGERDIRLVTADKLAESLGIQGKPHGKNNPK